jgi:flagellar protein FliO/FliZ
VTSLGFQSFFAAFVVLALVGALAWLVRRGAFAGLRGGSRTIAVETAVPIGDRRSLIIVAVEGRRLLLGLTPGQISMVTELGPVVAPAPPEPKAPSGTGRSFEQELIARAKGALGMRRTADAAAAPATVPGRFGDILQLGAQES